MKVKLKEIIMPLISSKKLGAFSIKNSLMTIDTTRLNRKIALSIDVLSSLSAFIIMNLYE